MPSVNGITHPKCLTASKPAQLISVFDYHNENISQAIITGKYRFVSQIYKQLGGFCAMILKREYPCFPSVDFIVPIPLFRKRERWRGFNQAEIFADSLSESWGVEMAFLLKRVKNTATQKDLDLEKRQRNMRQAFAVLDQHRILGKTILLVDDVVTTGATLLEAAKALKRAGAREVFCATIAQD